MWKGGNRLGDAISVGGLPQSGDRVIFPCLPVKVGKRHMMQDRTTGEPSRRNIHVVVATNREASIRRFVQEWRDEFDAAQVVLHVVEDNPERTYELTGSDQAFALRHYDWRDIEERLGDRAWIISRRSSAIKSFGFLEAYLAGADVILALDDDCYPPMNHLSGFDSRPVIRQHEENLFGNPKVEAAWVSSIRGLHPRGLPFDRTTRDIPSQRIALSHGLWANVPDLPSRVQLGLASFPHVSEYFREQVVPPGVFFPMCGMNLAWKREWTGAMYFMLMGCSAQEIPWGHHRFDDIWAGLFIKKILDRLGHRVYSGHPVVWHDQASDARANAGREASGIIAHEELSTALDELQIRGDSVTACYRDIIEKFSLRGTYWETLRRAMQLWIELFS